ncbi:MAG TPA: deoxyribonuclease IV [Candidatus Omnitrophota bacterium]|nr:deoxyribonuclease IV [Candidatus Omnitrophota bacterium]HPN65910.1 deoxyribonuclease IV [Candidatus Omnitrophota bacterium]HRZ67158.1 deoxyribonuclease IV [Candidatus Omnitrophota bacterium]
MKLGVHVSIAGHIYEAVDRAAALGCNAFQIFSRNPRGWEALELDPADVEEFRKRRKAKGISPVVVHIPYLINMCSPDDSLWRKSVDAYIEDIKRADMIGADYFVTHLGSPKEKGRDYGIARFSKGLNEAIAKAKPELTILLENTAGGGDSIGSKFEDIEEIIGSVKDTNKVGVCLDTAHTFEAGFDLKSKPGLEKLIKYIDSTAGLDKIKVIHFNDSMSEMGSHNDRHWHIGKGKIGAEGMKRIVNHPKLRDCAFILETPKETEKSDKANLAAVRKMRRD